MTLRDLFEVWAEEDRTHIALVDECERRWRRGEYLAHLQRTANALLDKGLLPGDHLAIVDGQTRVHVDVEYAAMLAGFVSVPLDPAVPDEELIAKIYDSDSRLVVVGGRSARWAAHLNGRLVGIEVVDTTSADWRALVDEQDSQLKCGPRQEDLASVHYSGGSSDVAQGIMFSQANLVSVLRRIRSAYPQGMGRVFLNVRPLWPIAALSVLAHLLDGARVVLASFDPGTFGELVHTHRATSTSLVPTQLVRVLDAGLNPTHLESLERIVVGAPLSGNLAARAFVDLGPRLAMVFGMTEAPWTCYLPVRGLADEHGPTSRAGSVGPCLPGCEMRIIDESGSDAPSGEIGEVHVHAGNGMQGYWRRPIMTADLLHDGWVSTGDLGFLDERGDLYVVGRVRDEIRTGGRLVRPDEVEGLLRSHPSVAEAAVVGVPNREWGQIVVAYVQLKRGRQVSESELVEYVASRASRYKKPRRVVFVPVVPRTENGELEKGELCAQFPVAASAE